MYVPDMLSTGKNAGMIKNTFSDLLKSGRVNSGSPFTFCPTLNNIIYALLNEIKRETVDNGVPKPILSNTLFNNNPKNIKNAMLNPTSNRTFSTIPISFSFNICRINKPGKMRRKRNPDISLKIGISKNIDRFAMRITDMASHPLYPDFNPTQTP